MTDQLQRSPVTVRRFRSTSVSVGGVALLAAFLTGCSSSDDYAQTCVDKSTNLRVPDDDCVAGSPRYGWYYIPGRVGAIPAIGSSISSAGGSFASPPSGSSVTRGGFGGSRGGFSLGG